MDIKGGLVGIYYNEKVCYFVNSVKGNIVDVSTVKVNSGGGMTKILDDHKEVSIEVFKDLKYSGAYTRGEINGF